MATASVDGAYQMCGTALERTTNVRQGRSGQMGDDRCGQGSAEHTSIECAGFQGTESLQRCVPFSLSIRREGVFILHFNFLRREARGHPLCGLETAMRTEHLCLGDVTALANALASNRTLTTLNLDSTDSIMHWR
jgi:hypothetical protein